MHAVVVSLTINDPEANEKVLREQVVPDMSHAQGFIAGYWTRKDSTGLSMILFESEDAANVASERFKSSVRPSIPAVATLHNVEVREVVAQA
jgi:hypothetical protein